MDGDFRIRLLGTVQAVHRGTALNLGGVRARSVLAVLMLHPGQIVPRRTIVDHAWPGDPPASAYDLVADYVSELRGHLKPAKAHIELRFKTPGYRADIAADLIDAHRFTELIWLAGRDRRGREDELAAIHLRQALDLWRGQSALADLDTPWLRSQADVLLNRRLEAFEQLAGLYLTADDPAAAAALLRDVVPRHPERDRMAALLVQALAALGESGQAADVAVRTAASLEDLGQVLGPHLRQAQTQALQDADRPAAARGPLHQLPMDPSGFTGRHEELTALLDLAEHAAEQDGPTAIGISAIDGMGGVGKTALALHAAHALTGRFPDGQLFVDLQGAHALTPRTPGDVLAEFLQAYGTPPQLIPTETAARAAAFRDRLAGTRTLILLDNAGSEDQIRPLLPGSSGCLVLITSRRRLKGLDDAHLLPVDVLPMTDAIALFRTIAGPARTPVDDPLLEEIATLCGQLPLALRIIAALFRNRPAWTLKHLAAQLTTRNAGLAVFFDGDRNLATAFDLSYRNLDPDQQELFRNLGLAPGPDADAYAAAALLDTTLDRTDHLLQDLVDHNLLAETIPGRYRLHDLLREHARTQAEKADPARRREDTMNQLLSYYAHTAQKASQPIARHPRNITHDLVLVHTPDLADPDTARAWLRAEHPNLDAAFTYAHTHRLDRHTTALAAGLAEILLSDGPWTRALQIHQAAETTARPDPTVRADALADLGRVRFMTGDYPGAAEAQASALEIYRQIGNRLGEAHALTDLGRVRQMTGDYPAAAEAQASALEIYRQIGDRLGEARALIDLGRVRHATGDYPGAAEAQASALEICRQIGNRLGEAHALTNLGRARSMTGDYPGAAEVQASALEVYRQIGDRLGEANALTNLGRVRFMTGDYPGAAEVQASALEIYRQIGDRTGEANALTNLGRVRFMTGDYPGAAEVQASALEIYRQIGDRGNEAWALNFYAAAVAALGDLPGALALYRQSLAMNQELHKPDDEALSLEGIADHHLAVGDTAQGTRYLNQALVIYQRLGMNPAIERIQAKLAEAHGQ
ncbi:tetratricopeptide repeat protein [Catenulispora rubra]|uniref:tetratricopeptide repeat protein n=1 Tax=Catenulispora rubra TaxID=280293 RepID=UPI0018920E3C|nr:tetratricopeptide repeat protein [Catenulispora rubra]